MSTQEPGKVARRDVVRAGAWSVPVLAVATAAPAAAASAGCTLGIDVSVALSMSFSDNVLVDILPLLTAGDCGSGAEYHKPMSVTIALDADSYTGAWNDNGAGFWSPSSGSALTFTRTSNFTFSAPGVFEHYHYLRAVRKAGVAAGKISFTFFGEGLTSTTVTTTPVPE